MIGSITMEWAKFHGNKGRRDETVERKSLEVVNWKAIHGPYLLRAGKTLNKGLGRLKIKQDSV